MSLELRGVLTEKIVPAISSKVSIGKYISSTLLVLTDYILLLLALMSAWLLRDCVIENVFSLSIPANIPSRLIYIDIPLTYIGLALYDGFYSKRHQLWQAAARISKISFYSLGIVILGLFFTKTLGEIPRIFIIISFFTTPFFLITGRLFVKKILMYAGVWQKPVVVIGAGKTAELLARSFEDEAILGYKIVGFIEDHEENRPLIHQYPHLGTFLTAEQTIEASGVEDVIIATPGLRREALLDIIYRVQPYVRNLMIVPDLFGMPLNNMKVETFFNQKLVLLQMENNLASLKNKFYKRTFDLIMGLVVFILILPVMLLVSILIKLDSAGPVFHIAKRLGKDGRPFFCYKFRTMCLNCDDMLEEYFNKNPEAKVEWVKYAKLRTIDPRITKVGNILRKYSLDELPQIINVIKGDMSLVGPRPYLLREKEKMGYYFDTIIETVPGVTGLWQVSGRNDIDFEGRLQMDVWYVRNWSLWMDIVMLFKTVKVVLLRKGAY
ncbi:UDP-glucose:undecaprenyl-phosphate glucose-1-phosphate transferase [Sporomusa ovata DSM 2662]|uniref:Undecaprenyl-phosphate galactosephosphotransferase n=1 Tax=Sporomusa ovata TaxID=2378 RepID=A0A0U1KUH6_9FIRM|nr:undecaprenyl-phosphate galactose phosphotransferase WbaP [Sporomusa ovata]EQB26459.1 UDP-galactose-lipid carrier transferase [Sporomusa ovata DSM 2662]CQR70543.1 Undecaprenyl-phosphate galactosephosphotransferase [Sporomusa ovata]